MQIKSELPAMWKYTLFGVIHRCVSAHLCCNCINHKERVKPTLFWRCKLTTRFNTSDSTCLNSLPLLTICVWWMLNQCCHGNICSYLLFELIFMIRLIPFAIKLVWYRIDYYLYGRSKYILKDIWLQKILCMDGIDCEINPTLKPT